MTETVPFADADGVPDDFATPGELSGEGRWLCIAFLGHNEHTGYVTEITKHGQPAYRIDLPEKIWGGNPLACITYAASSWFSDYPVTEESVRKAWEAERERDRLCAREAAEWKREREQRALEAAADSDGEDDGCPETSDGQHTASWYEGGKCTACGQAGPQNDDEEPF